MNTPFELSLFQINEIHLKCSEEYMLSEYTYAVPYGMVYLLQHQEMSITHSLCRTNEYSAFLGFKPKRQGDMVDFRGERKSFNACIRC